jgi:hypothetical protein
VKAATMEWARVELLLATPADGEVHKVRQISDDEADALGVATACALLTVKTDEAA